MLLQLDPVRGVLLNGGRVRHGRGAQAAFAREQRFGPLAIGAAIGLFEGRQLRQLLSGGCQFAGRAAQSARPLLAGGNGAEQVRFGRQIAVDLRMGALDLILRIAESAPLRIDLGAHAARQVVKPG